MYYVQKNPLVKTEFLICNAEGVIVCRLFYNDYATEFDEPEQVMEVSAQHICELLNKDE
jgi:hypothetical protein